MMVRPNMNMMNARLETTKQKDAEFVTLGLGPINRIPIVCEL